MIDKQRLISIFFELEKQNAHNINLVTPSHYSEKIIEVLKDCKTSGFDLPIVYNTSSYENLECISKLDGLADIYIPDLKFFSNSLCIKYASCSDYFRVAANCIRSMVQQIDAPIYNKEGVMQKGIIIRHLIMPGSTGDSKKILTWIFDNIPSWVHISLMSQYVPIAECNGGSPRRGITRNEYDRVLEHAYSIGLRNVYIQKRSSASTAFIPPFQNS